MPSATSESRNAAAPPALLNEIDIGKWFFYATIAVGVVCMACGLLVALNAELASSLLIDLRGSTIEGTAEYLTRGSYRLRYVLDSNVHTKIIHYPVVERPAPGMTVPVVISYYPWSPTTFQLAGISYKPATKALVLFTFGIAMAGTAGRMASWLTHWLKRRARRRAHAAKLAQQAARAKSRSHYHHHRRREAG